MLITPKVIYLLYVMLQDLLKNDFNKVTDLQGLSYC
jgi:hypothetical protein